MTQDSGTPPGWYHADGDPPGSHRYWDGRQWQGGPVPVQQPYYGAGYDAGSTRGYLPDIGRTLADPWTRIGARLLDLVFLLPVIFVVFLVAFAAEDIDSSSDLDGVQWWMLPVGLLFLVYEVAFVALKGGTPGKLVLGIGVVTRDGQSPPGWGPAALRSVLDVLGAVPIVSYVVGLLQLASLVLLFADPRRRTIPDRIANTYVVKTRP